MCVIAFKPYNVAFPSETILKNCYDNNPDGAGFMYVHNDKLYIRKGFTTYESFYEALNYARKITGDNVPYVMHFRIATQGYQPTMTHPFPLSTKMDNLKRLKTACNIGVAHNGIIQLTSDGSKDYSDTMKFITDYLALIIQSYDWYKNARTKQLIERLMGSCRLAILDKNGHCELLGSGWVQDKGCFYSNNSYSYKKYVYSKWWDEDDYGYYYSTDRKKQGNYFSKYDEYAKHYNRAKRRYEFSETNCPLTTDNDSSYCYACHNWYKCKYN